MMTVLRWIETFQSGNEFAPRSTWNVFIEGHFPHFLLKHFESSLNDPFKAQRSRILTLWSLHCRNSDQKDHRKNISFMRTELSIPGFKKKISVNTFYVGQTMYIVLCIAFRGKVAISWPSIPCPVTKIHQLSRPGCFTFSCSDLPITLLLIWVNQFLK